MQEVSIPLPRREDARRARRRGWRTLGLLVLLALAIHILLPQLASLEASLAVLRTLRWWGLLLAVLAQAASYWGGAITVRHVAALTGDRLPTRRALVLVLAASAVGTLGGGPVAYAGATMRWGMRGGLSPEGGVLCGWLPALLNALVMLAMGLVGTMVLVARGIVPRVVLWPLLLVTGALVAIGGAVALALRRPGWRHRLAAWAAHAWGTLRRRAVNPTALEAAVQRLAEGARQLAHGRWRMPALGALANTGCDLLTVAALFVAVRDTLPPAALLAGYGLPQLAGRLGILPGGLGIVEGGMVGAYSAVGVAHATAVVVVLAYRLLSFWIPLAAGLVLAARLERAQRHPPPVSAPPFRASA